MRGVSLESTVQEESVNGPAFPPPGRQGDVVNPMDLAAARRRGYWRASAGGKGQRHVPASPSFDLATEKQLECKSFSDGGQTDVSADRVKAGGRRGL